MTVTSESVIHNAAIQTKPHWVPLQKLFKQKTSAPIYTNQNHKEMSGGLKESCLPKHEVKRSP